MRKLTVLVGVPGSGKSTLRNQMMDDNTVVISYDDIKEATFGPAGPHSDIGEAFGGDYEAASKASKENKDILNREIARKTWGAVKSTKNVILDATSLNTNVRQFFLNRYGSYFDRKEAIWIDTPLDVSMDRNSKRGRVVPDEVIYKMNFDLQLPRVEEGFDAVYRYNSRNSTLSELKERDVPTIFFDMDGVVADFDKYVDDVGIKRYPQGTMDTKTKREFWKQIGEIPHFYSHLEPIPEGVALFNALKEKYPVAIITGVPTPKGNNMTAALDKIQWAKKYLSPDVPVYAVKKENKARFCLGEKDVLIDDYQKNVNSWMEQSGTGITFERGRDIKQIIDEIEEKTRDRDGEILER